MTSKHSFSRMLLNVFNKLILLTWLSLIRGCFVEKSTCSAHCYTSVMFSLYLFVINILPCFLAEHQLSCISVFSRWRPFVHTVHSSYLKPHIQHVALVGMGTWCRHRIIVVNVQGRGKVDVWSRGPQAIDGPWWATGLRGSLRKLTDRRVLDTY